MADVKTKKNDASVEEFLAAIEPESKQADSRAIVALMKKVTGEDPAMWGGSIVGCGSYDYKYDSGREGKWMKVGFAPRKQTLTVYIMAGFKRFDELMAKLGKHSTGKSCLYIKKLEDVDVRILEELMRESVAYVSKSRPSSEN